jgi:integrase
MSIHTWIEMLMFYLGLTHILVLEKFDYSRPSRKQYMANYPQITKGKYLFPANGVSGYHSIHNLEKTFRRLWDRIGSPWISPHKLRHYFATYALRNGAKLEMISKILGHSSVAITADVSDG